MDYYLNEEGGAGEERRKNKKSHISKFYINKSNNKINAFFKARAYRRTVTSLRIYLEDIYKIDDDDEKRI